MDREENQEIIENDMLIDGYEYKLFWKARKGTYNLQKIEKVEY